MWPGARAPIGIVAELVDVHAPLCFQISATILYSTTEPYLSRGIIASNVISDSRGRALAGLLEGHGA